MADILSTTQIQHTKNPALEAIIRQDLQGTASLFLTDREAKGLSRRTVKFYRNYLVTFLAFCQRNSVTQVQDVQPSLLRKYLVILMENHNPGGVHAAYRTLRAFFHWIEREELLPGPWKNPILKVDAPKVSKEVIEPIGLKDVDVLLKSCNAGRPTDKRDRAIFLTLLDSGVRAQELCDMNLEDFDQNTKCILVRKGKGGKPRIVVVEKTAHKALLAYLRQRNDSSSALFVSKNQERLTYEGLRQILRRRSKYAGLTSEPTLHDFRRAFALSMLRNGVDIFALQRLMGHADISILRRYLAQTDDDIRAAHRKGSPVEHSLQEVLQ